MRVYSSTMPREPSNFWKIDGVIQGSSTSQPPKLTPRTLSFPHEIPPVGLSRLVISLLPLRQYTGPRERRIDQTHGAAWATVAAQSAKIAVLRCIIDSDPKQVELIC